MNWITVAVVGVVAVWFEYSYRKSRHKKAPSDGYENSSSTMPVTSQARVSQPGSAPSIVPGDENDRQMNSAV